MTSTHLNDPRLDGVAEAGFVRSAHEQTKILHTDTAGAPAAPRTIGVLTADDAAAGGLRPLRPAVEANR